MLQRTLVATPSHTTAILTDYVTQTLRIKAIKDANISLNIIYVINTSRITSTLGKI